ncbi:MAG: hypothetical protein ACLQMF_05425 [Rectinemataceae bacterium]
MRSFYTASAICSPIVKVFPQRDARGKPAGSFGKRIEWELALANKSANTVLLCDFFAQTNT